jgi:hypothetical protein
VNGDESEAPQRSETVALRGFRILGAIFGVTALLILLVGLRLAQRGRWLPGAPSEIGAWTVAEKPLSRTARDQLGFPNTRGWVYTNLFEEKVEVHVISTPSFECYLDPTTAMSTYGYRVTAERQYPLFGGGSAVRALMFQGPNNGRTLLYYWVQYKDGRTNPGAGLIDSRDFVPRLKLGLGSVLDGTQSCIIRAFTDVNIADGQGLQARRNLNEVCIKLHDAILAPEKKGEQPR